MSIQVDKSRRFNDDERAYLSACNRDAEIEENDQNFPVEENDQNFPVEENDQNFPVEENDSDSYSNWKNAELKAEIDSRNSLRSATSQIPMGTNKEALVSALEADDAQA